MYNFRKSIFNSIRVTAFLCGSLSAGGATALSDQSLCAQIFQKYGVRSEHCRASPPPGSAAAAQISSQTLPAAPSGSSTNPVPAGQISAVLADGSGLSQETLESHIFFPSGHAINDDARVQLAVLNEVFDTFVMRTTCIRLIGHSDTSGSVSGNLQVSQRRAEAVAQILRDGLADPTRIQDVTFEGESRPLVGLPGSSAHNRRVEIQVRTCGP